MDLKKRKRLKKITKVLALSGAFSIMPKTWTAPVINSIILPAHAQISLCADAEVAGNWRLREGDLLTALTLNEDGTGFDINTNAFVSWALNDRAIEISIAAPISTSFTGVISAPCDTMSGLSQGNAFTGEKF